MAGFRHCSWCHGKGCMCCDGERAKWSKEQAKRELEHANRTPDQIRESISVLRELSECQATKRSPKSFAAQIAYQMAGGALDYAAINAELAKEEALLDAEYHRQFPNGPQPIFSAKTSSPGDMAAMRHAFGIDALNKAFGEGGGGMAEIERLAGEARAMQAANNEGAK